VSDPKSGEASEAIGKAQVFGEIGVSPLTPDSLYGTLKLLRLLSPMISTASGVGASGAVAFPTSSRCGASPMVGFPCDLIDWLIAARENRPIGLHRCLHRVAREARTTKPLTFFRNSERANGKSGPGSVCGKYATRLSEAWCDGIVGREACEIAQPGVAPADGCIPVPRTARISAVGSYGLCWGSPVPQRYCEHHTLLVGAKQGVHRKPVFIDYGLSG
jgi:hypothetical protein